MEDKLTIATNALEEIKTFGGKQVGVSFFYDGEMAASTAYLALQDMTNAPMPVEKIAMGCKPDPYKFTVTKKEHVNGHTIIQANYGGDTFNGEKLMLLKGVHEDFTTLDPHFLDEDHIVIAL